MFLLTTILIPVLMFGIAVLLTQDFVFDKKKQRKLACHQRK